MREFTEKEREKVYWAFDALTAHLEMLDWTLPHEWREAFKAEKRECTNAAWARALMVANFVDGVRKPEGAADLLRIRTGCRMAHMIGAEVARQNRATLPSLLALCDDAIAARNAAFARRCDSIGEEKP